jgi:putative membrane protein
MPCGCGEEPGLGVSCRSLFKLPHEGSLVEQQQRRQNERHEPRVDDDRCGGESAQAESADFTTRIRSGDQTGRRREPETPRTSRDEVGLMYGSGNAGAATAGAATGVVAAWIKARSEPPLQRIAERIWPPSPEQKELVGHPAGHPDKTPPAVMIDKLMRTVVHRPATRQERMKGTLVVHYLFGAGLGAGYALAAQRWPVITRGAGSLAGAALYVLTHGTTLPVLHLQDPPWQLPMSAVAWEFSSHVEFGVVLDLLRRIAVAR